MSKKDEALRRLEDAGDVEPRDDEEEVEANPPVEETPVDLVTPNDPINAQNLQVRGIHLKGTGMSFILGEANVNGIDIAQNPDTGVMLVRVKFKGTRKARVFEVTPMDFITELAERSPLVIASSL